MAMHNRDINNNENHNDVNIDGIDAEPQKSKMTSSLVAKTNWRQLKTISRS